MGPRENMRHPGQFERCTGQSEKKNVDIVHTPSLFIASAPKTTQADEISVVAAIRDKGSSWKNFSEAAINGPVGAEIVLRASASAPFSSSHTACELPILNHALTDVACITHPFYRYKPAKGLRQCGRR